MANPSVDFYLEGVANFTICTIGLGINAAAIGILCRQKSSSLFVKLMISLVTYDLIYVFLSATCFSLPRLSSPYRDHVSDHLAPFLVPITQMALSGSVYTTVALTVERYISVVVPFFRQRHNLKAWVFILPVAIFVIAYSIPRFFEARTQYLCSKMVEETCTTNCTVEWVPCQDCQDNCTDGQEWKAQLELTELRKNPYYVQIYALYLNLIVNICLPLTSLVAMNICIYRTMRNQWYHGTNDNSSNGTISPSRNHRAVHFLSSRQSSTATEMRRVVGHGGHVNEAAYKKRDAKYTRAAVVMVVAFVVCNTPRFVPNIMEIFIKLDDFPSWGYVLISVNHMLTVFNSAFNFLIYWSFCCGGRKRRRNLEAGSARFSRYSTAAVEPFTGSSPAELRRSMMASTRRGDRTVPGYASDSITMPVTVKNRAARERCEQVVELEAFIPN